MLGHVILSCSVAGCFSLAAFPLGLALFAAIAEPDLAATLALLACIFDSGSSSWASSSLPSLAFSLGGSETRVVRSMVACRELSDLSEGLALLQVGHLEASGVQAHFTSMWGPFQLLGTSFINLSGHS